MLPPHDVRTEDTLPGPGSRDCGNRQAPPHPWGMHPSVSLILCDQPASTGTPPRTGSLLPHAAQKWERSVITRNQNLLPVTSLPWVAGAPSAASQASDAPLQHPHTIMHIAGLRAAPCSPRSAREAPGSGEDRKQAGLLDESSEVPSDGGLPSCLLLLPRGLHRRLPLPYKHKGDT